VIPAPLSREEVEQFAESQLALGGTTTVEARRAFCARVLATIAALDEARAATLPLRCACCGERVCRTDCLGCRKASTPGY
jgi:hypothetical protein